MTTKAKAKADERSESQAKAQYGSIKEMVERLNHAQTCKGDCDLDDATIKGGIGIYHKAGHPTHGTPATDDEREQYHDEDQAREAIAQDALSVEIRSDWHTPGSEGEAGQYMILLCTGGPACRIVGDLNEYKEPETAKEERWRIERERRKRKPFSAKMHVRFIQVCPFCSEEFHRWHSCQHPNAPKGTNQVLPAERIVLSYR